MSGWYEGLARDFQDINREYGIVTALGYLYCPACANALDASGEKAWSEPHISEPCDRCGRIIRETL